MTGTVDIQELKRLAEEALRRPLNAYHEPSIEAVNFYRAASPSTILALIEENERLREALAKLHHAVCGETGFAESVRNDSKTAYPWPALDIADELARTALGGVRP